MRKILVMVMLAMFGISMAWGQSPMKKKLEEKYGSALELTSDGKKWYVVGKSNEKGAADDNGKLLIPLEFDDVSLYYKDKYIKAIKDKKTSIYNLNGKLIIATPYEDIRWWQMKDDDPFCEVKQYGKWGLMDKNGKLVVPCEYEGISTYETEKTGYCEVKQNRKCGVYDIKNNRLMVPCLFDDVSHYQFGDDDFAEVKNNGKKGIINRQGELVIPCDYDDVSSFQLNERGFCEVKQGEGVDKKKGIYDIKKKKEIVACRYDQIDMYTDDVVKHGFYIVVRDNLYGVSNSDATEIIPCQYTYLSAANEFNGKFFVAAKGGTHPDDEAPSRISSPSKPKGASWGALDSQGREVVPFQYDEVWAIGDIAVGEKGGKWKVEQGNAVYDYHDNNKKYYLYSSHHDSENAKRRFHNMRTGKSTDCKFTKCTIAQDYIACTNSSGKWGFVDAETMEVAIPFEYDAVEKFKDGVAQVQKDGKASFVTDPKRGTSLTFANGGNSIKVDGNIPQTNDKQEEAFAFIIANENYVHLKGADYAINDGKVFKEYCLKTFGMPESNVRYYEDATYGNIVNAVKKIKDIADVYDGDAKIIVYYSGLGTTDAANKGRYILPTDASIETLNVTGYSVQKLMDELNALNTKQTVVILDAPFSGLNKEGKMLGENRGVAIAPKPATPKGHTVIVNACSGSESAYSLKDYGHGLFTYAFLDKVQNTKGKCTLKEAVDYATTWVKKASLKHYNKTQTPQVQMSENIQVQNISF